MRHLIADLNWQPDIDTNRRRLSYGEQMGWKATLTLTDADTAEWPHWTGDVQGPGDVTYTRGYHRTGLTCSVTAVGDHGPGCDVSVMFTDHDAGVDFASMVTSEDNVRYPFNDLDRQAAGGFLDSNPTL